MYLAFLSLFLPRTGSKAIHAAAAVNGARYPLQIVCREREENTRGEMLVLPIIAQAAR